jgi:tetratricopeptide (TPR) repeat protein
MQIAWMSMDTPLNRIIHTMAVLLLLSLSMAAFQGSARASTSDTLFKQAQAASTAGNYTLAAHDFEQAILQGHNDPNTYYLLGLVYAHLKRWDDSSWAVGQAMTDPVWGAINQKEGDAALIKASAAGGAIVAPPPILKNAKMTAEKAPAARPSVLAARESQSAYEALLNGTFFVAPEFNKLVTYATVGALSAAAADLNNNSNTTAKFAYIVATPAPYTSLAEYTQDLFTHLKLQRAVLVVMTQLGTSVYTDRLDAASAQSIAAQTVSANASRNLADRAAAVARAVIKQADANDDAASRKSAVIGIGITLIVLILVGLAIARIMNGSAIRLKPNRNGRQALVTRARPR